MTMWWGPGTLQFEISFTSEVVYDFDLKFKRSSKVQKITDNNGQTMISSSE